MSVRALTEIISPYFTENVLLDVLIKESGLKDVFIDSIRFGDESKKGDSYLSTVCRFVVEATGKNDGGDLEKIKLAVIVKFLPKNLARRKTFRSLDFFENEAIFYDKVWPAMCEFKNSKNLQGSFNFIPNCLSVHIDGKNDYIAMEDLSFKNYKSATRSNGLDLNHAEKILHLFAQFHALSLAFKNQHREKFESVAFGLKETYFAEKFRSWYQNFQKSKLFPVIRDAVEKELPQKYLDKIDELFGGDLFGKLIDLCQNHGEFAVIAHGDVWVPNFLIKYDDGGVPDDIILIDFQLTRYASLSTDLTFFLYACIDYQLLNTHWDHLLKIYHQTFAKTLKTLGSDPSLMTYDAMIDDVKKFALVGAGMSMEAITMSLLEDDEVADIDLIQGDDAVDLSKIWDLKPFKEANKRQRIAFMIKHAVDKGFI